MKKLGFIGGGNMAAALASGLIANRVFKPAELIASDVEPKRRRMLTRTLKIETTADNVAVMRESAAVLLAVKPQTIDAVLTELAGSAADAVAASGSARRAKAESALPLKSKVFISIAAGVPIARLEGALGPEARVIRVMPNAPAMVGQGMAALVRGHKAKPADEAFALKIFRAVGDAIALKNEGMLDAVTALSGSGPAYLYLFVKALADGAVKEGLPAELAIRMALKTIRGAEETMRNSKLAAAELIRIVASPGGTTEAALARFDAAGFSGIVEAAVHAAAERSRELGRVS